MSIWFRDSRQFPELQAAADVAEFVAESVYNASRKIHDCTVTRMGIHCSGTTCVSIANYNG
jgi:hypothetical protein